MLSSTTLQGGQPILSWVPLVSRGSSKALLWDVGAGRTLSTRQARVARLSPPPRGVDAAQPWVPLQPLDTEGSPWSPGSLLPIQPHLPVTARGAVTAGEAMVAQQTRRTRQALQEENSTVQIVWVSLIYSHGFLGIPRSQAPPCPHGLPGCQRCHSCPGLPSAPCVHKAPSGPPPPGVLASPSGPRFPGGPAPPCPPYTRTCPAQGRSPYMPTHREVMVKFLYLLACGINPLFCPMTNKLQRHLELRKLWSTLHNR